LFCISVAACYADTLSFTVFITEMEPGHGSPGHWVTGSAILTGSGRVTGQCVRSVFDPVSSFNMRVYHGIVSTE